MPVQYEPAMSAERYYRIVDPRLHDANVFAWFISDRGPLGMKAARAGVILPPPSEVSASRPAIAHLNRWRWVVACPDCGGDFQLAFEEPRLFLCSQCWNAQAGGEWRAYVFPESRREIERALDGVPRADRNWLPGWSVERASIESGSRAPVSLDEYRRALKVTA